MPLHPHPHDRLRRTQTVLEILRRRAAQRDANGQEVPPALRAAIADFDKQLGRHASASQRPPRSESR